MNLEKIVLEEKLEGENICIQTTGMLDYHEIAASHSAAAWIIKLVKENKELTRELGI